MGRAGWWLGGSPCSGKSTVASLLADAAGIGVYSCDDAFDRHAEALGPVRAPTLTRLAGMGIGPRLAQPVDVQVRDVQLAYREQFPLILADVGERDLVVEGAALLPDLMATAGVPAHRVAFMVPTDEFQRHHYGSREWARLLLADLPDPGFAFERWMLRDAQFARLVEEQARDLGYRVFVVDGTVTPDQIAHHLTGSRRNGG